MGLAVEVGALKSLVENDPEGAEWFRNQVDVMNQVLRDAELPEHVEPTNGAIEVVSYELFGYSGLHYLRRVAVHLAATGRLPRPGNEEAPSDPLLARAYVDLDRPAKKGWFRRGGLADRFRHLLDHSDAEGFYVPVDFDPVLRAPPEIGERVGSSQALVRELQELSEALQIPPDLDPEATELWDAAVHQGSGPTTWQQYGIESFTCHRLLRAARQSVATRALLIFT
jgi:hypothetical protein